MRHFIPYLAALLAACTTTAQISDVQAELIRDRDVSFIPATTWSSPSSERQVAASTRYRFEAGDAPFYVVTFDSDVDLLDWVKRKDGMNLLYSIQPCERKDRPGDSRLNGDVEKADTGTSSVKNRYSISIPANVREHMHHQSSVGIVQYQNGFKDVIDRDTPEALCVFVVSENYISTHRLRGRVGSLDELGIDLDGVTPPKKP